jgi:hypothetical protein
MRGFEIILFQTQTLSINYTVFKKWKIHDLDGQLLLVDKQKVHYIKQHLKSLNVCTKVTPLPLLWQQ